MKGIDYLENWENVGYGYYRYYVSDLFFFEIFINYCSGLVSILEAKGDLYFTGNYKDPVTSLGWFARNRLMVDNDVRNLIEYARNYIELRRSIIAEGKNQRELDERRSNDSN